MKKRERERERGGKGRKETKHIKGERKKEESTPVITEELGSSNSPRTPQT